MDYDKLTPEELFEVFKKQLNYNYTLNEEK